MSWFSQPINWLWDPSNQHPHHAPSPFCSPQARFHPRQAQAPSCWWPQSTGRLWMPRGLLQEIIWWLDKIRWMETD